VQAGPAGSTFVSSSTLPAADPASPIDGPPPGNWAAS